MTARSDIVAVEVLPWESNQWAVAVKKRNGREKTYPVGTREEAEEEARKLAPPKLKLAKS